MITSDAAAWGIIFGIVFVALVALTWILERRSGHDDDGHGCGGGAAC